MSTEEFYTDLVDRIKKLVNGDESVIEDLWIWLDDGTLILSRPETHIQVLFPCDSHPLWGPDGSTVLFVYEGQLTVGWLDDLSISAAGNGLIGSLRWMGP